MCKYNKTTIEKYSRALLTVFCLYCLQTASAEPKSNILRLLPTFPANVPTAVPTVATPTPVPTSRPTTDFEALDSRPEFIAGLRNVPVNFYVVTRDNGTGNEKWFNRRFLYTILNRSIQLAPIANFSINSIIKVRDSRLFNSNRMRNSLNYAKRYLGRRRITVIISGENTTDAAGLANGVRYARRGVLFAMRSRDNTAENQFSNSVMHVNARLFLHELGHQMNMRHGAADYKNPDKFQRSRRGLDIGVEFIEDLMD